MIDYKAIALGPSITAREANNGQILLFVPSDETESGDYVQSSQIWLSREMVAKLAKAFPEKVSDGHNQGA